jgi:hypothetical protein
MFDPSSAIPDSMSDRLRRVRMRRHVLPRRPGNLRNGRHLIRHKLHSRKTIPRPKHPPTPQHLDEIRPAPQLIPRVLQTRVHPITEPRHLTNPPTGRTLGLSMIIHAPKIAMAARHRQRVPAQHQPRPRHQPLLRCGPQGHGGAAAVADGGGAAGEDGSADVGHAEQGRVLVYFEGGFRVGFAGGHGDVDVAVDEAGDYEFAGEADGLSIGDCF